VFYAKYEDSASVSSRTSSPERYGNKDKLHSADVNAIRNERQTADSSQRNRPRTVDSGAAFKCYECGGRGHFARECPTRAKRLNPENSKRNGRVTSFFTFARQTAAKYHQPSTTSKVPHGKAIFAARQTRHSGEYSGRSERVYYRFRIRCFPDQTGNLSR
jgi:hypothetical protein